MLYSTTTLLYNLYHYLVNEFVAKASTKRAGTNLNEVPLDIFVFGIVLTSLSLFHYLKNTALRNFAMKLIKQKIDAFRTSMGRPLTKPTSMSSINYQGMHLFKKRNTSRGSLEFRNQRKNQVNIILEDC